MAVFLIRAFNLDGLGAKLGILEGSALQFNTSTSWTIRIDLQKGTQTIEYPSLSCGGDLTLLEESPARLMFSELITFGSSNCITEGFVELLNQPNGDLT